MFSSVWLDWDGYGYRTTAVFCNSPSLLSSGKTSYSELVIHSPQHFQFHLQPPYFIEKLSSSHNFPALNDIFLGKDEQLLKKSSPPSWVRIIRLDFIASVSLLFEAQIFSPGYRSQYSNVEGSSLKQPTRGASKLTTSLNF